MSAPLRDDPERLRLAAALADRYTLVRELGGGGMSRVWLAREVALGREVVVKVVGDGTGLSAERFAREVQLAARLQQANIVPLLAAGEADGLPWYTMPYVDGESLRARLQVRGTLPVAEAVSVMRDVARALAYAHERGVVHRDIKPENILLSGGAAVVTDFGIAKAISEARTAAQTRDDASATDAEDGRLTREGTSLGTPAYMAPEQVAADPATDHRADLYALGCVAYELLTGAAPFSGRSTTQLLAAHLTETPVPLVERRRDVPSQLAALIMQCLAKAPGDRPAAARDVVAALETVSTSGTNDLSSAQSGSTQRARPVRPQRTGRLLVASALVVAAVGTWFVVRTRPSTTPARDPGAETAAVPDSDSSAPEGSIAVMPFVNLSGSVDDEYFSDGLTDELANAIRNLPGLRLAGRSSSFAFKGKNVPAVEIGRALGVRTLVEGTVRRSGSRVRLAAQLTSAASGEVLWSDVFENAGGDVFAVQDTFTRAIVVQLAPLLARGAGVSAESGVSAIDAIAQRGTTDAEAFDLYLRGRFLWAQRGAGPLDSARVLFQRAVARDPRFARGWAGLALTYVLLPNYDVRAAVRASFDSTEVIAARALALDSTLADAWSALGLARFRKLDFDGAGEALARARVLEPRNATAHQWSAFWYGARGDYEAGMRERDLALAIDPLSATILNNQVIARIDERRWAAADSLSVRLHGMSRLFEVSSNFVYLATASVIERRAEERRATQQRLMEDSMGRAMLRTMRGAWAGRLLLAAATGRWPEARALRDSIARGAGGTALDWDRAHAELIFGTRARAAALFVSSFEREGTFGNLAFSACTPILDFVRDDPAWQTWRTQRGVAECPHRSTWPELRAPENR